MQKRIGFREQVFRVLKFRTLKEDVAKPLEQRQFWLGRWLRRTSLDELPQVINILQGQMSFIGPRPLPVEYLPFFKAEHLIRHSVRPGISGWAQVNGRHSISWEKKFDYDRYYVQNISFWLDTRIVFKTIGLLLSFRKDGSLRESKFTGNA